MAAQAARGTVDYARFANVDASSDEEDTSAAVQSARRYGQGGLDLDDPLVQKLLGDGTGGLESAKPGAFDGLAREELRRGIELSAGSGDVLGEANFSRLLARDILGEPHTKTGAEAAECAEARDAYATALRKFEQLGAPTKRFIFEWHETNIEYASALRRCNEHHAAISTLNRTRNYAVGEVAAAERDVSRRTPAAGEGPADGVGAASAGSLSASLLLLAQAQLGQGDAHLAMQDLGEARRCYDGCIDAATELSGTTGGTAAGAAGIISAAKESLAEVTEGEMLNRHAPYLQGLSEGERAAFESKYLEHIQAEAERAQVMVIAGEVDDDDDGLDYTVRDVGPKAMGPAAESKRSFLKEVEALGPTKLLSMMRKSGQGASPEMARAVHQARAMAHRLRSKGRDEDARALEKEFTVEKDGDIASIQSAEGGNNIKGKGKGKGTGEASSAAKHAWHESIVADVDTSSDEEGGSSAGGSGVPRTWEEARKRMLYDEMKGEVVDGGAVMRARSPERASSPLREPAARTFTTSGNGTVEDDESDADDDIMSWVGGGDGGSGRPHGRARAPRSLLSEEDGVMELGADEVF